MNNEKDNFSKLIEDKLNELEVPYNEAHWDEMSQKLDQLGPISSPSNSIFTNKYVLSAAAGIIAVAGWVLLSPESTEEISSLDVVHVVENEIASPSNESEASTKQNAEQPR